MVDVFSSIKQHFNNKNMWQSYKGYLNFRHFTFQITSSAAVEVVILTVRTAGLLEQQQTARQQIAELQIDTMAATMESIANRASIAMAARCRVEHDTTVVKLQTLRINRVSNLRLITISFWFADCQFFCHFIGEITEEILQQQQN